MTAKLPKISIITPSFNQGQFIEETILSVIDQGYPNLEYIIVDGGSSDNTVEIIKKYEKYISYWVSEKDKGQSHAIHKGFSKASGDVFNWINSDDVLEKKSLDVVGKEFSDKNLLALCGKTKTFDAKNVLLPPSIIHNEPLNLVLRKFNINQPSTFYNLHALREIGSVNQGLHFIMDHEWWFRFLLKYGVGQIKTIDDVLAGFRIHDTSKTITSESKFRDEYASLLYYLSEKIGFEKYLSILKEGNIIHNSLFANIGNLEMLTPEVLEEKILIFLLKKSYLIFSKEDYLYAKKVSAVANFNKLNHLSPAEKKQLDLYFEAIKCNTWNSFRIQRKFKKIFL